MKKFFALILTLVMMLSIIPCQGIIPNANAVDTDEFDVSIFWNNFDDPHLKIIRETLNESLSINNFSYKNYDADNKQATQTAQIETAIANGTDLLVVSIVEQMSNAPQEIVNKAKAADIPVIFFSREVFDNAVFNSYDKACFVGSDPLEAGVAQGVMAGEYFVRNYDKIDLNGDGKISYIMMSGEIANPIAQSRTELSIEYANDILESVGKPALVYYDASNTNLYQDANWSYATASELMTKALATNPMNGNAPIEAVFANNDDMALGCIKALNKINWNTGEEGSPSIPVFGSDYTTDAQSAIEADKMTGTVKEPCESITYPIMMMVNNVAADLHVFKDIANAFPVDAGVAKVRVSYEIITKVPMFEHIIGDVDNNSVISNADLVLLARYIVKLVDTMPGIDNADMNFDGEITNADLVELAITIVHLD